MTTRIGARFRDWFSRHFAAPPEAPLHASSKESKAATKSVYSTDRPIDSPDEDRFDRRPFAHEIARTIAHRIDPSSLVIAIYGVWGDGKTSTLGLLRHALGTFEDVVVVKYNPWYFREVPQLLRSFFETLADALDRSIQTKGEKIGSALKEYGGLLSLASVTVGGVVSVTPGAGVENVGRALSAVEIEKLRDRLSGFFRAAGKKVVVLIDDIDRLDKSEIRALLKLVKLSGDFEHVTYVLAFDDAIVAESLGEAYGASGTESGRRFLEKIIQVALHLPAGDPATIRRLAFEGIEGALSAAGVELSEEQAIEIGYRFNSGFAPCLSTPRQARRLQNALAFAIPLLKGEVRVSDQVTLEATRVFFPAVYLAIREHAELFIQRPRGIAELDQKRKAETKETIEAALKGAARAEHDAIIWLLQELFPLLKGVYSNRGFGPEWDERWDREQRICSDSYFDRYFRYTVPKGDCPDTAVEDLIRDATTEPTDALVRELETAATEGRLGKLISKLEARAATIPQASAIALIPVLARMGDRYPREQGFVARFAEPFTRAAILIGKLLEAIPQDVRERSARQALELAPVPFGVKVFQWMRHHSKDSGEVDRILSDAEEKALGNVLTARICVDAELSPPYVQHPQESSTILWVWLSHDPGGVKEYLQRRFSEHPDEVPRFLMTYVPSAWGMETGLPARADFGRDSFKSVTSVIDPALVASLLQRLYGDDIGSGEYYMSRDIAIDKHVAHQFLWLKNHADGERNGGQEPADKDPPLA